MKKLAIAAFMLLSFAGATFAQTNPAKKSKPAQKMEQKKEAAARVDTVTHKHMHKVTKKTKA